MSQRFTAQEARKQANLLQESVHSKQKAMLLDYADWLDKQERAEFDKWWQNDCPTRVADTEYDLAMAAWQARAAIANNKKDDNNV